MDINWSTIAGVVAPFAPKLGQVLGASAGPFGSIIGGLAGQAIAAAFQVDPTPEAVGTVLAQDPQAGEKLQQIEADRGEQIRAQAEVEIKRLETITAALQSDVTDREGARNFTTSLMDHSSPLSKIQKWIAVLFITGFFALLGLFLLGSVNVNDAALLLLGVLVGAVKDIVSFFFGSSAGSQSKDVILKQMAEQNTRQGSL